MPVVVRVQTLKVGDAYGKKIDISYRRIGFHITFHFDSYLLVFHVIRVDFSTYFG